MDEFEIEYTFGWEPLQQYLIRFPGGRLQALSIAWDVERRRWFHLYPDQAIPPDDWLHWTRNGQNWNGMCAECHSTDLRKSYDPATDSYETTWAEIDVSCEACHGPGSRHVEWAKVPPMARPEAPDYALAIDTGTISSRDEVDLCAPCHSRRTELGDYDHTRVPLLDNHLPALLREGLYHADGQILEEVYVWGSFVQSKMYQKDVRCSDCHDVHSLELRHEGNRLCLQCHQADAYDTRDHHFHKKIHEGRPSDGALCVRCHMAEQPFMVIDYRADHSFRVPRPDLTIRIGVPNACSSSGCHDDKPVQWSADAYAKWYGQARKPQYGPTLHAGRRRDPAALEPLIGLAEDRLAPGLVRATALSLLRAYQGEETTAVLRRALLDDDALIRHTAVESVNVADPDKRVELLAPLLFDPARAVRLQAAVALAGTPPGLLEPYQEQALDEAIAEHRRAMEYSLDFAFAGFNLGNLHAQQGDMEVAEAFYRKAIEVDDLFVPAKMNLAVLLDGQGRTAEAAALLEQVIAAYPDNLDAAYSLALSLAALERYDEADGLFARVAAGRPDQARVHYNRGLLLQRLGRDAEAEDALRRALEVEPESFDFLYALADFFVRRGRVDDAADIADRLVAAHPQHPFGHEVRAWAEAQP
jgi:tetratricopeptide (TPR) repeat protein